MSSAGPIRHGKSASRTAVRSASIDPLTVMVNAIFRHGRCFMPRSVGRPAPARARCRTTDTTPTHIGALILLVSEPAPDAPHPPLGVGERASRLAALIDRCQQNGIRVFFFGGQPQVIYALREAVTAAWPTLTIAGICDGNFQGAVSRPIIDHIRQSKPGVIVTDMAELDFLAFSRLYARNLSDARLVNLRGTFMLYARQTCRPYDLPGATATMGRLHAVLDRGCLAARYATVLLGQLMRGLTPTRPAVKLRREL